MENIKISVIVPIYNTEKFLRKCIESIVNQTLQEIEIILINDGSTDNSHNICLEYAEKYPEKIRYINNKNIGCSATRNLGIKLAQGEYIAFVDSDDYIEPNMYKEMYDLIIKNNFDLVITGIKYLKKEIEFRKRIPKLKLNNTEILYEKNLLCYVWNKLFKKDLITKNNLFFLKSSHFGEDMIFCFMYCLHIKSIGVINKINYNYILHGNNSVFNIEKRLDVFKSFQYLYDYLKKKQVSEETYYYFYKLFDLYAIAGSYMLLSNSKITSKQEFNRYKKIFLEKNLTVINLPLKNKLYLYFWYFMSHIIRFFKLNEILLLIKRKIRKEI